MCLKQSVNVDYYHQSLSTSWIINFDCNMCITSLDGAAYYLITNMRIFALREQIFKICDQYAPNVLHPLILFTYRVTVKYKISISSTDCNVRMRHFKSQYFSEKVDVSTNIQDILISVVFSFFREHPFESTTRMTNAYPLANVIVKKWTSNWNNPVSWTVFIRALG